MKQTVKDTQDVHVNTQQRSTTQDARVVMGHMVHAGPQTRSAGSPQCPQLPAVTPGERSRPGVTRPPELSREARNEGCHQRVWPLKRLKCIFFQSDVNAAAGRTVALKEGSWGV